MTNNKNFKLLDVAFLEKNYVDDLELIPELISIYIESTPEKISKLEVALECGNGEDINKLSHFLKGSVGTFGDSMLKEALAKLEDLGRISDIFSARKLYEEKVGMFLREFVEELSNYLEMLNKR